MPNTGTTTYFDYGSIGEFTGTSNAVSNQTYTNTINDVFGTNPSQGYLMDWMGSFPNYIGQSIEYDQVTDHPYETIEGVALTSSYRGATKYFNVNALLTTTTYLNRVKILILYLYQLIPVNQL